MPVRQALGRLWKNSRLKNRLLVTRHTLDLDLERRKKIFEMKVHQYEDYVGKLDDFGRKNQVEIPAKMKPMIQHFFADYLKANDEEDQEGARKAITVFSESISTIMQEGLNDYLKLKSESNKLKLTATPMLLQIFSDLEQATKACFDSGNKFMGNFLDLTMNQKTQEIDERQREMTVLGEEVTRKSDDLMACMWGELSNI